MFRGKGAGCFGATKGWFVATTFGELENFISGVSIQVVLVVNYMRLWARDVQGSLGSSWIVSLMLWRACYANDEINRLLNNRGGQIVDTGKSFDSENAHLVNNEASLSPGGSPSSVLVPSELEPPSSRCSMTPTHRHKASWGFGG